MIFCRTKVGAAMSDDLVDRGFAATSIHGDLNQFARRRPCDASAESEIDVLVATDVAARGIDVEGVSHVINYQCPEDEQVYVHRIGRTGRAGASGIAITFVDWADQTRWKVINNTLGLPFERPETYSTHRTSTTIWESILQPRAESHAADRGPPIGRIGRDLNASPHAASSGLSAPGDGYAMASLSSGSRPETRSRDHGTSGD